MKKEKKNINPEIQREQEEKRRSKGMYNDDAELMSLFPYAFSSSTASATESTGLIQVIPPIANLNEVYDEVYDYRQTHPIGD